MIPYDCQLPLHSLIACRFPHCRLPRIPCDSLGLPIACVSRLPAIPCDCRLPAIPDSHVIIRGIYRKPGSAAGGLGFRQAKHISAVITPAAQFISLVLNHGSCSSLTESTQCLGHTYLLFKLPRIDGESRKVSYGSQTYNSHSYLSPVILERFRGYYVWSLPLNTR